MTFETFARIAAEHRPDAVVHAHKAFGGVPDVAIYFRREDGSETKVYHYRGSYADILCRLGIKVATKADILSAELELRRARERHGKPGLFTKGKPMDASAEIARLEAEIAAYYSDEYIRV